MPQVQLGGPIGPFFDNVQRRQVPCTVTGTVDYTPSQPADPAQLDAWVRNQIMGAVSAVIGHKMASGALQFRNLGEANLLGAEQEIIQQSGLPQAGVQVGRLQLAFGIDGHAPAAPPQREVKANIHLHGVGALGNLNIKASSKGGIDTAHLGNQLVDKAKSAIIWYVVFGVLTLAIVGGTIWYIKHSVKKALDEPSKTAVAAKSWDGKTTFTCTGSDVVAFDGITAKLDGPAIVANGACKVTLTNCDLTGADAIEANGSAVVVVTGGSLTGSAFAVKAMGSASVTLKGTKVTGKTQKLGGATITGP